MRLCATDTMHYKVVYHTGPDIGIRTRMDSGVLTFQDESVCIAGKSVLTIPLSSVTSVKLFRLHGLGRMIKMVCTDQTHFLTVVRINLFGYFFIVNFIMANQLYETLKRGTPNAA